MAVVQPLFHSQQIRVSRGVNRHRVRIPYKVLLENQIDYQSVNELRTPANLDRFYFTAIAQDMQTPSPVVGLESAVLVEVDVVPTRLDVAIVLATFASNQVFSGGIRPRSRSSTRMERYKRPRYTAVASAGGPAFAYQEIEYNRATTVLIKQVVTAAWRDEDDAQQAANAGHIFHFGGIPFLYAGADVLEVGNGQTLVEYRFWSVGPMHAIPAGAIPGDDIALPPLGFLDEWVANHAGPSIGAQPFEVMYGVGGRLPHSNIDGGGG